MKNITIINFVLVVAIAVTATVPKTATTTKTEIAGRTNNTTVNTLQTSTNVTGTTTEPATVTPDFNQQSQTSG